MLTTSLLAIVLQSIGVITLLVALYLRTSFRDKMVSSMKLSVVGSIVLLIYSALTLQFIMILLNLVTLIMSIKGVRTWNKERTKIQ